MVRGEWQALVIYILYMLKKSEKGEGGLFTIDGNPVDGGDWIYEEVMYLSIFYCLCLLIIYLYI